MKFDKFRKILWLFRNFSQRIRKRQFPHFRSSTCYILVRNVTYQDSKCIQTAKNVDAWKHTLGSVFDAIFANFYSLLSKNKSVSRTKRQNLRSAAKYL